MPEPRSPQLSSGHHIFDRPLMVRRRDRFAAGAQRHDFLLHRVAEDFADRLSLVRRRFALGVNLGAYHGVVSRRLRELDTIGLLIDLEPSEPLLTLCGGPRVRGDEEMLPFRNASLDLVVSGLSLHLVNDLPGTLIQVRRALKPDGLFLAALLGGRTLHELRETFLQAESELERGSSPRVAPFADVRELGALLQRADMALPVTDADTVNVTYSSALDLMRELHAMGASNVLIDRRKTFLRKATLFRAAEIYAKRHSEPDGRVRATFEIVTMTGWAPHESQQTPLRPGSATGRLADALGAVEQSAKEKPGR